MSKTGQTMEGLFPNRAEPKSLKRKGTPNGYSYGRTLLFKAILTTILVLRPRVSEIS